MKVAFLGLGAMGVRMAAMLLRAGHAVTVWNRTPSKMASLRAAGAGTADTPRTAVAGAEITLSMLRDDDAAQAVWLDPGAGALAGLAPGAIAIDCSTVTPAWARTLAARCRDAGIGCLDAPVAGSRPQAESGQLIFLVGGEAAVLARAVPLLQAMGVAIHHAGASGSGAVLKLVVNALFGVQVAALAELLALIDRTGLDTGKALDIIGATPVVSPVARSAAASMQARAFAPLFPAELALKDIGYALATAEAVGGALPLASVTRDVLRRAVDQGYGAEHLTGLSRLYW